MLMDSLQRHTIRFAIILSLVTVCSARVELQQHDSKEEGTYIAIILLFFLQRRAYNHKMFCNLDLSQRLMRVRYTNVVSGVLTFASILS